jgi:WD40 repeat protein
MPILMLDGHSGPVNCVAFSPDGKHIVSCASDRTIRVWDAVTGEAVLKPLEGHMDPVTSIALVGRGPTQAWHERVLFIFKQKKTQVIIPPAHSIYI